MHTFVAETFLPLLKQQKWGILCLIEIPNIKKSREGGIGEAI